MTDNEENPEEQGERDETPAERLDRNWAELLQELRVTQTGIQILLGFMLAVPFQPRFDGLDPVLVGVYLGALASGILCTAFIVAPVTAHRLMFRSHAKDVVVAMGNRFAQAGLALLAVTLALVVTLLVGFIGGTTWAWTAGGVSLLVFVLLWVALPLWAAHNDADEGRYT